MFRKSFSIVLILMMLLGLTACNQAPKPPEKTGPDFKIGVMTGTAVQNEEEYQAGLNVVKKYGDMIIHTTYPAKFTTETETTISNLSALAADPEVKALVICQAVVGSAAAIDKVRETRPDMLIIAATPGEDRDLIAGKADIVLQTDGIERGRTIVQKAHEMGATTFIHYSFARHMASKSTAQRKDLMEETCDLLGIEFIMADAPDPTGEGGTAATQQFMLEDIPRKIAQYGVNTAFFGTNCSMQEPMIKQIVAGKALYPVQCCPSPYHALPGALGISIPDEKKGDLDYVLEQIKIKLTEVGMEKRVSTWPIPMNMLYLEGGVAYAKEYLEGKTDGMNDTVVLERIMSETAGKPISFTMLEDYLNYYMYSAEYVDFSK